MRRTLVLALGLALGAASLGAQERKADAKAPAAPAMEWPKPGPEMARLKAMIGTWHVEDIHEPGFMGPGGKGHGTGQVKLGPGGLSLIIEYACAAGPMKGYRGHGIVAWDGEAKAYKQSWTDNMAPMLMQSAGNWAGDTLVMTTEGTMMGKAFKSRDTFTGIGADGYTITTEVAMEGGPMKKVMTLVHTRAKAQPKK